MTCFIDSKGLHLFFHSMYNLYLSFPREANRRAHSKPGAVPFVPEKVKNIVAEKE